MFTLFNELLLQNAELPIFSNDSGNVNALRLQPEKAAPPISVTPSGIVTLSNDEHPEKHLSGIVVTTDGIFIAFSDLHELKAWLPKVVNDSGSATDSRF